VFPPRERKTTERRNGTLKGVGGGWCGTKKKILGLRKETAFVRGIAEKGVKN